MESNKKICLSEELNKFKDKLAQNWFINENKNSYLKHRELKKNPIPNRNKTKIIINMRRNYDLSFIHNIIEQGITTFKLNGKLFNHKEYTKIIDDINSTYANMNETPSIIFDFKGPEIIVTKVQNIHNRKSFNKNQIVNISFDSGCNKFDKANRILVDKRISNLLENGDIIEISDSSIVLKVISIEKIRKKTNRFGSFLKILEDNSIQNSQNIGKEIRKFNFQEKKKITKLTNSNSSSNYNKFDASKITQQKEFNSKIIRSHVSSNNIYDLDHRHSKTIDSKLLLENDISLEYQDSNTNFKNFSPPQSPKINKNENLDLNLSNFKNYERKEDDKDEYRIIYEGEESDIFGKKDDNYEFDLNVNSQIEEQKDYPQNKLGIIDEESSCEFELEDFLKQLHLNDDEEFPLDGKYFDNIYHDRLKTKKEKMDLIFQNIIKRQKKNKLEQIIPSIRSSEIIDNQHFLKQARENYDLYEIEKIKHFERKGKIKSSASLDKISHRNFDIICEVLEEGSVNVNSSLSIKNKEINNGADNAILSAKDIIDINKCLSLGINNLSFILNNVKNIEEIKDIISEEQLSKVKIFARLETQESLINFDSILREADGIILNHGFKFFNFQYKDIYIIEKCKQYNKPLILQTNSIKSINLNKPAIFKVSILDFAVKAGIDGIIIKDEVCGMQEYINTIKASRNVIIEIEKVEDSIQKYFDQTNSFVLNRNLNTIPMKERIIMCILDNAVKLSHEINADLIILFTDQVKFAKILSNLRPPCVIACPTSSSISYRFLRLFRGVIPYLHEDTIIIEDLLTRLIEKFRGKNIVNKVVKCVIIRAYLKRNQEMCKNIDYYYNGIFCYDF